MKMSVGIIGGLGPEATSEFYLGLIKRSRKNCGSYPRIIIDSISFPFSLEEEIIQKSKNEYKILPYLKDSVNKLNKIGVDFIVIPCNTVHIFIGQLGKLSRAPILSILDETVKAVKAEGYKKIGLLATTKTIDSKLYETPLVENKVDVVVPEKSEQATVAKIILKILDGTAEKEDRKNLLKVVDNLVERGSECILLGCTDIQSILNQYHLKTKLIDSLDVLASATFDNLMGKDAKSY